MELFPSEYIHIGGDEAPKFRWENCPKCQRRIREEGLNDAHELQAYFIRRIENFLNANGRKLIGWDEIMEGGLSPTATVQAWRGIDYGLDAIESGNQVIFSPTSHSYLDYDLKAIDLQKVYSFTPVPGASFQEMKSHVKGMEVNMWTEHVPNEVTLDQKVFPRLMAMAEVAWRYDEARDFDAFLPKVRAHYPLLDSMKVSYGPEAVPVRISTDSISGRLVLSPGIKGLRLNYQYLDSAWRAYTSPIQLSGSGDLNLRALLNNKPYGPIVTQPVAFHTGVSAAVSLHSAYSEYYAGGGTHALNDGLLGTLDFRDGRWQGYFGEHLDANIDLNEVIPINEIALNFYQYNNAWIFLPKRVAIEYSMDGKNWSKANHWTPTKKPEDRGQFIETMTTKFEKGTKARYLRVTGENLMKVPDWHEAAGSKAWLFVDEIIIR
jgi:hexosaminidase